MRILISIGIIILVFFSPSLAGIFDDKPMYTESEFKTSCKKIGVNVPYATFIKQNDSLVGERIQFKMKVITIEIVDPKYSELRFKGKVVDHGDIIVAEFYGLINITPGEVIHVFGESETCWSVKDDFGKRQCYPRVLIKYIQKEPVR